MNHIVLSDGEGREVKYGYARTIPLIFTSTADTTTGDFSATWIPDAWDAYYEELGKIGQTLDGDTDGYHTPDVREHPYSSRLRPNRDVSFLHTLQNNPVLIDRVAFHCYQAATTDTVAGGQTEPISGDPYQVDSTNIVSRNSQAQPIDAYGASRFRGGLLPLWQPNYFNPIVKVNGSVVFGSEATEVFGNPDGNRYNKGDLSIGLYHPCEFSLGSVFTNISSIEVYGQCLMPIWTATDTRKLPSNMVCCTLIVKTLIQITKPAY